MRSISGASLLSLSLPPPHSLPSPPSCISSASHLLTALYGMAWCGMLYRDRRKLTFYFVAEKRIDFRELVRELFRLYKTRIWMASLQGPSYEQ